MTKINSIIFGILFPAAFLSTYEIIYHFSFPLDLTSNELFQIGNGARYLATGGVLILPLFLLRNELTFRRISRVLLIIFVAMWIVWFFYGFPQYYIAGNGLVYSSPILKTNDPWDTSLFYNFGSKAVLAALFASILKIPYWKEFENLIISGLRSSFARKQTRK